MAKNYTPLDYKRHGLAPAGKLATVDRVLVAVIVVTLVVLGVLVYMLLSKQGIL